MAAVRRRDHSLRRSLYWDETDCLHYYGMLSLHEVLEVVGSQLTETDVEVLSFLLDEGFPKEHPLNPEGWTVERQQAGPDDPGVSPSPALLNAWKRLRPRGSSCPTEARHKPKSGPELLLELERQGYLSDGKLEPLLELLRVLTRHDLLPFVSHKRRRTVSPEMIPMNDVPVDRQLACPSRLRYRLGQPQPPTETQMRGANQVWRGIADNGPCMRRRKRGHGWSHKPKKTNKPIRPPPPIKETYDVRLRVRAEYMEHDSVLRGGVSSNKPQPLERQFELFSRANSLLRARDLGCIVCDIKFTELENLVAFWCDYQSGALLEALKGVFITDSMRREVGTEGVKLLISVDQEDYEEGYRMLMAKRRRRL